MSIDGLRELQRRLEQMLPRVRNEVEQGLINGALIVERDYKLNVSQAGLVDTGLWINTITHEKDNFGTNNPSVKIGSTIKDPPYPMFHEFGTTKFPAKYPLTRAFRGNEQNVRRKLAEAVRRGLGL